LLAIYIVFIAIIRKHGSAFFDMDTDAPYTSLPTGTLPITRFQKSFKYNSIQATKEQFHMGPKKITDSSNIALLISYFLVGFGSFITTPLSIYLVHTMGAQPWQQNTIGVVSILPWTFKIFYGFVSDVMPIGCLHRKPYFTLGYFIQASCYFLLSYVSSFQQNVVSFECLALIIFTLTSGTIMADVMADTLVVEYSGRTEHGEGRRGQTQATCFAVRFFGSMLGNLFGTVLYNRAQWGWGLEFWQVTLILGLLPWLMLFPTIPYLYECPEKDLKPMTQQIADIWDLCQQKAVWKPMAFIYVFNLFQVPCVAWSSFLLLGLKFQSLGLGMLNTAGAVVATLGILTYKRFFFQSSWRSLYIWCTALGTVMSVLQIMLVLRWNITLLHMPDFMFAMGDNVVSAYNAGILAVPVCVMYLQLCPKGSEGASYAMLTTFGNMAMAMSTSIGTSFGTIWEVSNLAITQHNYSGLLKLSLLTSFLKPLPLVLIWLLPSSPEKAQELKESQKRSRLGGQIFVAVLVSSMLYTTWEAFSVILAS